MDDYKSVLSKHCMATVTTYGVRKSRTNIASCHVDKENDPELLKLHLSQGQR